MKHTRTKKSLSAKRYPLDAKSVYAVILAGGIGSRFWPLSRELEAKQFLSFGGDKTLLAQTIERIKPLCVSERIIIVGSAQHKLPLERHAEEYGIPVSNIILEPSGKNTAPAIALAAKHIHALDKNAVMIVLPADHYIRDTQKFLDVINNAVEVAKSNSLVTLGITPTVPHTGYGYIKIKSPVTSHRSPVRKGLRAKSQELRAVYSVDKFVEKPNRKKAELYFKDKHYFWNSGMFIWTADAILKEIKQCLPEVSKKIESLDIASAIDQEIWNSIQSISIDYGVLERSKHVAVIPAGDIGWSDLGSWSSMTQLFPADDEGNVIKADSIDIESRNVSVFGNNRLIATIGLKDTIIVDTDDALLVCNNKHTEKVKQIVEKIKQDKRQEHITHKTVKRPWGSYTVLNIGNGFKVKSIQIEPFKKLSLQRHNYRSEHWVVVEGQAKVTNGDKTYYPRENESIYITQGHIHRLENPINKPLRIIEVQCGHYLEEDDIERLDDDFARKTQMITD